MVSFTLRRFYFALAPFNVTRQAIK